ncbi:hypothetical protein RCZ04_12930 [Capnocytophaga sp. HP1101]
MQAQQYQLDSVVHIGYKVDSLSSAYQLTEWQRYNDKKHLLVVGDKHITPSRYATKTVIKNDKDGNEIYDAFFRQDSLSKKWRAIQKEETKRKKNKLITISYISENGKRLTPDSKRISKTIGRSTETTYYKYLNKRWLKDTRNTYTQNEKGRTVLSVDEVWDSDAKQWQGYGKVVRTFANDTLLTEEITYTFGNNEWFESEKTEHIHPNENERTSIQYVYREEGWLPTYKVTYTENKTNRTFTNMVQVWDKEQSKWQNESKLTDILGENNYSTSVTSENWNKKTQTYELYYTNKYFYNENNELIEYLFINPKEGENKSIYEYNSEGNLLKETRYKRKSSAEEWKPTDLIENTLSPILFENVLDKGRLNNSAGRIGKRALSEQKVYRYIDGKHLLFTHTKFYYSKR